MKTTKHLIIQKIEPLTSIGSAMILSIVLLMLRVKLNKSFFYLFLVWNLFLAAIPYAITMYVQRKENHKSFKLLLYFGIWLLFLPNAPYIVTDLLHLRISQTHFLWLDVLVVLSFAAAGLLLFYLSLKDMQQILESKLNRFQIKVLTLLILFLSAFGVYLGRFLRYNSWEILSQPKHIISDICSIIFQPQLHKEAWLFTLGFGFFLYVGYWIFKTVTYETTPCHPHNPEDS
ncbi:MAG: DUF1361 domain-containing protein [Bacteroidota bacterium]